MAITTPRLGALLRRLREQAGLTQQELAERAGVSERTIGNIERGRPARPHKDTLQLLADALGLSEPERAALESAARAGALPDAPIEAAIPVDDGAPPLVGRAAELALLERHLAGQGPPALLLAGEPGIGKSRLLREAARRAAMHGWSVLRGGCQRRDGEEPYAPLLEALDGYLQALQRRAPGRLSAALRGCAWLVRLLPELAALPIEPLPSWTLTPAQERRLIYGAVGRLLANVAGPAGTVLLLDDLQWAGPDALDLLAALLCAAPEAPLRVIGAYRDTETQPRDPLSTLLGDLAQARLAAHHSVRPLSAAETALLLDGMIGSDAEAVRDQIVRRTGGVPFVVVSYAQALRSVAPAGSGDDGASTLRGDAEGVPWDVAQGLRQRLDALPKPARRLLETAAVLGRQAPRSLLVATVARREDAVLRALEAACRARLLVEEEGAAVYAFPHDVVRETVETELSGARRIALHRRVATVLERQPGEPALELLAYHYTRGDDREKAIIYLERAGDQARARAAPAAARDHYQALAERLRDAGRPHDEARALEKLGVILYELARYDDAIAALTRASELFRQAGDLGGVGRVTAQLSYVYIDSGRPAEGERRVRDLLEPLEASGAWPALAALYPALAAHHFISGRYRDQLAVAERAVELTRRVGIDKFIGDALSNRGGALLLLGRYDEAMPVLEETCRIGEKCGDLNLQGAALTNMATISMYRGEFKQSLAYTARSIAAAERRGEPNMLMFSTLKRAIVALFNGEWRQAHADLEALMSLREQIGTTWGFAYTLLTKGTLHLLEGEWEEAVHYLEESAALAEHHHDLEALRWVHSRLAERDILAGPPHGPQAAYERIVPLLDRPGQEDADVMILLPRLAWAQLEMDDAGDAAESVTRGVQRAREARHRIALVDGLWVLGLVRTRQRRWDDATAALDEGLELARSMPYPYAEARLLQARGQMHAARDAPQTAREYLEAARAIFQRLGARKDAARVAHVAAPSHP